MAEERILAGRFSFHIPRPERRGGVGVLGRIPQTVIDPVQDAGQLVLMLAQDPVQAAAEGLVWISSA